MPRALLFLGLMVVTLTFAVITFAADTFPPYYPAGSATGGWYFDLFLDGSATTGITREESNARCSEACHQAQEARDFVFSDPRR